MQALTGDSVLARWARVTFVACYAAVTAFAGVFSMPPLDRDESRFAQATVQMLESGDFVTIRFQDDERNKKPAGIYWLQALSVSAFSSVEAREIWAYRLPSAVGAIVAALFTYVAGARLFGPGAGLLAAMLLAASPAVAGEATIAKTDAMLLATVTAAQAAFIHIFGAATQGRRASLFWALLFWAAIGAGVLIKGPIILMVVGLTGAMMAVHRPDRDWVAALRPVTGAIILVVMIAPWAAAIHQATEGRFFIDAIGGDMLAKLGDAKESHSGPPGYYGVLLFALFWPAAALILPGVRAVVADRRAWESWFLIGWAAPAWLVFEAIATKLPHYALPLYPAIALMAARAIVSGDTDRWSVLRKIGASVYLTVGLAFAALIAVLPVYYEAEPLQPYGFTIASTFGLAVIVAAILFWRGEMAKGAIAAALLSSTLAWTLLCGVLPNLDQLSLSPRLSAAIEREGLHPLRGGAEDVVLSGYYEPSAIFLLGTGTLLANGRSAAELMKSANRAAVVEGREDAAFKARLDELGEAAAPFAEIDGVNYSNGKSVALKIYRLTPQAHSRQDAR
jgi:4-amino-4-deoxy-L-arabinose transferase-like glycosyltransferase